MLRVLTLSTLFPDATRPTLGVFVERQTQELARRANVDVRVIAPRGLPPGPLKQYGRYRALTALPEREDWNGLDVSRPSFCHLPRTNGILDPMLMVRALAPYLWNLRREFPFDVIDAEFFFPDGPAAARLGRIFGVPVSIKARGADILHWSRVPSARRQIVRAGQLANGLLAVSDALRSTMSSLGIPPSRISVHYTGVDLELFHPVDRAQQKAALGITTPLVVSVANLIPRKRQSLLIDAMCGVPGCTLVLLGYGPDERRLAAQIQQRGLADRVRLLGAVPQAQVAQWLGAADVMALPSASEGLANAWVESLACGTPLVLTDVGGARELVTDPVAGHFVTADAHAIASAIRDLLAHPRCPQAVRACATGFTWRVNSEQLHAHLSGIVAAARDHRSTRRWRSPRPPRTTHTPTGSAAPF